MPELHERFHDLMRLLVPINSLPARHQDQLLRQAELLEFKKKQYVFRQGDRDEYSYYLLDGRLELYADDQLIKSVEGGTGPAFHALAQLQPRQLSARARTPVIVLRVDRPLVDKLLSLDEPPPAEQPAAIEVTEFDSEDEDFDWLTHVLKSELFKRVPPSNIQRLLDTMESVEYPAGTRVVEQDAPGDYYYIIQHGHCEVTRRAVSGKGEVRLAELGPGDSFGEEALVSGSRRNASVRMLSAGELVRLTKADFIELIKKPVVSAITVGRAHELAAGGAVWLDVRQPEEHAENGLEGSVNLPLNLLRQKMDTLDPARTYIACCDTGGRSSTAAFLLAGGGLDAHYVEGGIAGAPAPATAPAPAAAKATAPDPAAARATVPAAEPANAALDADVRAESLKAELARATLQLEQAERLKQQAEQARIEAERQAQEKLQAERAMREQAERARQQAEQARIETERQAEERLRAERAALDDKARRAEEMLASAQRLQAEIEAQKHLADQEVARRRQEEEQRIRQLQAEVEGKLRDEENRLQQVYRRNAEELENIQRMRAEVEAKLAAERERLEADSAETHRRLEDAVRREQELEAEAQRLMQEQEKRERELQETARRTIGEERRRLEAEFARTAEALEQARAERAAAEATRRAAAAEAERIIAEYKTRHERLRADERARLDAERQALQAEAAKIAHTLEQARLAKERAETAQRELEEQRRRLAAGQGSAASAPGADARGVELRAEIDAIEARAAEASRQLHQAQATHAQVEAAQRENEQRLERTHRNRDKLDEALAAELQEWISEQERLQDSTPEQEKLEQQAQFAERIRRSTVRARSESAVHDQSLLDDIAAALGHGD